jgi:hypothetical protein
MGVIWRILAYNAYRYQTGKKYCGWMLHVAFIKNNLPAFLQMQLKSPLKLLYSFQLATRK